MLGTAWLPLAAPVGAHHAFSIDAKTITLKGTITRVEWINPHVDPLYAWGDNGVVEKWMIEAGSPNTLVRRGMTRDSIPPGTEVVVFGYRHRNGTNAANGRDAAGRQATVHHLAGYRSARERIATVAFGAPRKRKRFARAAPGGVRCVSCFW